MSWTHGHTIRALNIPRKRERCRKPEKAAQDVPMSSISRENEHRLAQFHIEVATWGRGTARLCQRGRNRQTGCDVDSEMKPFLGGPYPVLCFQSTPTFFNSCCEHFTIAGFRSLFLLGNRISPGPAAQDQLSKVGGGSGSCCLFRGELALCSTENFS